MRTGKHHEHRLCCTRILDSVKVQLQETTSAAGDLVNGIDSSSTLRRRSNPSGPAAASLHILLTV